MVQSEVEFYRLASEVDQIVYCGALVNHRLSYQDLFEPNIVGTAELICLALAVCAKQFVNIPTVGVPYTHPGLVKEKEDVDVRAKALEMSLSDDYALGYSVSKWASEVLLRDAYEPLYLPVCVFRPNMILAHSQYYEQINIPDMFTRLLFSLIATGRAPESFYQTQEDGSRARAHFNGTPVDVLTSMMCEISDKPHNDYGISYDTYVD